MLPAGSPTHAYLNPTSSPPATSLLSTFPTKYLTISARLSPIALADDAGEFADVVVHGVYDVDNMVGGLQLAGEVDRDGERPLVRRMLRGSGISTSDPCWSLRIIFTALSGSRQESFALGGLSL